MNYGPILFLVAFLGMAGSWFGFVLSPQIQIGRLQPTNAIPSGAVYPVARPGLARQGLDVYRANGCVTCHTRQIGQTSTSREVLLSAAGTNQAALVAALVKVNPAYSEAQARETLGRLPQTVLRGAQREDAEAAIKALSVGGAKAQMIIRPAGPDIARGWGARRSVADDYLYDSPALPGEARIGPDLSNVGLRQPDPRWHLVHLYAPRAAVRDSIMPPDRFLFEKRRIERAPSPDALVLPAGSAPEPGYEIVPTPDAIALTAYLLSLHADAPLFVAPMTALAASAPPASAPNAAK